MGELSDGKEVCLEGFFDHGEGGGSGECLRVSIPGEEGRHVKRWIRRKKRSGIARVLELRDASEDDQVALYSGFPAKRALSITERMNASVALLVWICHEFELLGLGILERADLTRSQDVFCELARFIFTQAPAYEATVSENENFAILAPTWDPPRVVEFLGIWCEART